MKVLVTGGAGFIGSHCIDALLARGDSVICLDNFNDFYNPKIKRDNIKNHLSHPNYTLYEYDLCDQKTVEGIKHEQPERILHLAARAGVQPSRKNPLEYNRTNISGTFNLLEAATACGIEHLVFASSSSVYGGNTKTPFSETDPVDNPYSPYAATKRCCEIIASNYHHLKGMHIAALRYFTVYGPRNRPDMAIFTFAKNIREGIPIKVYHSNQQIKRDFTYIQDIVTGTIAALDNVHTLGFEIINLGNATPIPLPYFVELLEQEFGKQATIEHVQLPSGDVPITYADITKAKKLLNWEPTTPIEQGIKKFAEWFKNIC